MTEIEKEIVMFAQPSVHMHGYIRHSDSACAALERYIIQLPRRAKAYHLTIMIAEIVNTARVGQCLN